MVSAMRKRSLRSVSCSGGNMRLALGQRRERSRCGSASRLSPFCADTGTIASEVMPRRQLAPGTAAGVRADARLIDLVDDCDRRPPAAPQPLERQLVLVGPLQRLDHQHDQVGIGERRGGGAVHGAIQRALRPRCRPGVSTKAIWPPADSASPSTRWRVVCGRGVTMLSFCPSSAFSSVDLPTLGRPTSATKPTAEAAHCAQAWSSRRSAPRPVRHGDGSTLRPRRCAGERRHLAADAKVLRVRLALDALDAVARQRAGRAPAAIPAAASSASFSSAVRSSSAVQRRHQQPAAATAPRDLETAVEIQRAAQRLERVGEDRLAAEAAGLQLAGAQRQHIAEAECRRRPAPATRR